MYESTHTKISRLLTEKIDIRNQNTVFLYSNKNEINQSPSTGVGRVGLCVNGYFLHEYNLLLNIKRYSSDWYACVINLSKSNLISLSDLTAKASFAILRSNIRIFV